MIAGDNREESLWISTAARQSCNSLCRNDNSLLTLAAFEVEHPDAEWMRRTLKSLGAHAQIVPGSRIRLKARLGTPKGDVDLS